MSEKSRRVYCDTLAGGYALVFDPGLGARAFARARFSRFLSEEGVIVFPGGRREAWKAGGVEESGGGDNAAMLIWGPAFRGARLDLLVNGDDAGAALFAVSAWMDALLALGDDSVPLWPAAAFIALPSPAGGAPDLSPGGSYPPGTVFFAPENIAGRCVQAEGEDALFRGMEQYLHPDFEGTQAAAFTAAAMLYRVFAGRSPFAAADRDTLRADMREGNFLPVKFAAAGLDGKTAGLIQGALTSPDKSRGEAGAAGQSASRFAELRGALEGCAPAGQGGNVFFKELSDSEKEKLAREERLFRKKKNIAVKSGRFVRRNIFVIACAAALVIAAALIANSVIRSNADRPTTAGMAAPDVVRTYYDAMGKLDSEMMEACAARGAGKNDINMVSGLFVISRVRQAYESTEHRIVPADEWARSGFTPADETVFGVTGLRITPLQENPDGARFRAEYTLWLPPSGEVPQEAGARIPGSRYYSDELELAQIRGNWRIVSISREEKPPTERRPATDR